MTKAAKPVVCYPLVHLNGTSKDRLIEQLGDAYHALGDAYDKLKQAAPNQRDYYPLPENWWSEAQSQHRRRQQAIDDLRADIQAEIELIDEPKPHNWNEYAAAKTGSDVLGALKQTLDALYNETHGRDDSPWIKQTKERAKAAIESAQKGGAA